MPEYAALAVCLRCVLSGRYSLIDGKILVIPGQNLELLRPFIGKADEVFDNVQKALLFKDALKERVKLRILGVFVAAVFRFPFHKAIFAGGNGSCLGSHKVAHYTDTVINKHRGDLVHIIPNLRIGFGSVGFLTRG